MKRSAAALVLVMVAVIAAESQTAVPAEQKPKPGPQVVYVRCGKLVAESDKPPLTDADVIITDGKVTAVGRNLPVPAGAQTVDFSHDTVLPGLLDAHIHLWTGPFRQTPPVGLAALRAQRAVQYALSQGIVAVRVVGTFDFIDVDVGKAADEGTILGPHVVPAAHAISIPGGHGDFFDLPWQLPLEDNYTPLHGFVNSPADAEKAVHLQLKYGARVIKVMASGGVLSPLDSPTSEQLSPEELKVIVEQAHMANVKVAAHAENIRSIMAALNAGVDSIEHGSELDQQAIDFMKTHHVYLDSTLFVVDNVVRRAQAHQLPEYVAEKGGALAKKTFPSFAMALKAGVTMAAGSDQDYEPGKGTLLDELIALVEHGMSADQALTAATKHNSDLLGLADLGTVAVGKEGDLVAIEGDPLADIHSIKNVRGVVFKGKLVPAGLGAK